jgi:hypothetical protein
MRAGSRRSERGKIMAKKKRKYDQIDEVMFMTIAHFGTKISDLDDLCCLGCRDAEERHCPGEGRTGTEVLACMLGKVLDGEKVYWLRKKSN